MQKSNVKSLVGCYHCGKGCYDSQISLEGKYFCCKGCKGMYEILSIYNEPLNGNHEDKVNHLNEDLKKNDKDSRKNKFVFNFDNDYKLFFQAPVCVKKTFGIQIVPVSEIQKGDRIIVHNDEILSVDAILFNGTSNIDYSYVTGKSSPWQKGPGEILYAGGRHFGNDIELEVIQSFSQSHLIKLWNDFKKNSYPKYSNLSNSISKYFIFVILLVAFISALYWVRKDIDLALNVFITVLIVSFPIFIVLTGAFARRTTIKIFRKNKFYLKDLFVIDKLSRIDSIVFDKTGTITNVKDAAIEFAGNELNQDELTLIKSLVRNSSHPLSKKIYDSINADEYFDIDDFSESVSQGISGSMYGDEIKLGNARFLMKDLFCSSYDFKHETCRDIFSTNVFLSINHFIKGYFSFSNKYREGLDEVIKDLSHQYSLSVISGDNNSEKCNLRKYFKDNKDLLFDLTYSDKLKYIVMLQNKGRKVLMIGDGLNDAAALKQSNAGITVSEDIKGYFPSCDAIIEASGFSKIGKLIKFTKSIMNLNRISLSISLIYSLIAVYLSVQGELQISGSLILMSLISFTIILFEIGSVNFLAKMNKL